MVIDNLEKLLEELKSYASEFFEDGEIKKINYSKEKCDLNLQINKNFFVLRIYYKNKQLYFEGALNSLIYFYLHSIFSSLRDLPFVMISVFFRNEDMGDAPPLNDLIERLVFAGLEYRAFTKFSLKEKEWDGRAVKLPDIKNVDVTVSFDKENLCLTALFEKANMNIEKYYTVYEWYLYFLEDLSWIGSEKYVVKQDMVPPVDDVYLKTIKVVLEQNGASVSKLIKSYIEIPSKNSFLLRVDFFMTEVEFIIKLYTDSRPYKSFNIKIPFRHDIKAGIQLLHNFLYLINTDTKGEVMRSMLGFYSYISDIPARMVVG